MALSSEIERSALMILLKDKNAQAEAFKYIPAEIFNDPAVRELYITAKELYKEKGKVTITSLNAQLFSHQDASNLKKALMVFMDYFSPYSKWDDIREAMLAEAKKVNIEKALRKAYSRLQEDKPVDELMSDILQELMAVMEQELAANVRTAQEVATDLLVDFTERMEGIAKRGIYSSLGSINYWTEGFQPGDLIIIAGRPSMGKSAFAGQLMMDISRQMGKNGELYPSLIFALEMKDKQVLERMVAREAERDASEFRRRPKDEDDKAQLMAEFAEGLNTVSRLPIFFCDKRGLTTAEICSIAKATQAKIGKLACITVDYLQLIRGDNRYSRDGYVRQVGQAVLELRNLAGELNCPLFLLSQLNRGVESRDNKRPQMSDLRDSGNIEEHADLVMLLYRDAYYTNGNPAPEVDGITEVIIAKQRTGKTGTAYLHFSPETSNFRDIDNDKLQNYLQAIQGNNGKPVYNQSFGEISKPKNVTQLYKGQKKAQYD